MNIKFRENFARGQVWIWVDDVVVYQSDEFMLAMRWATRAYNLSDEQQRAIQIDYKEDYDAQRE